MNSNNFEIQVKGLFGLHKNTIIEFDGGGIMVHVSLNIEPEMKPYLCQDRVFKSGKYWVYVVRKHIPSKFVDQRTVYRVHNYLLCNAMTNCREAKIKVIESQVKEIRKTKRIQQLQFNF